jgi:large subunit ribosomal protein L32
MGVPKRKTSKMRRRQRQAHTLKKHISPASLDPKTGSVHLSHRVDPKTGMYRGRQVLIVSADE